MGDHYSVELALDAQDFLGEGPIWSPKDESLYWVDIKRPAIRRWSPSTGEQQVWMMPSDIGSMALRAQGGMIVALRTGLAFLDMESGDVTPICDPEAFVATNRFNDGKCDRQGRFWAGTMDDAGVEYTGALYRIDTDLTCHKMVSDVCCSNGLGWSPDGLTMYYSDTWTYRIDQFDFDPETGEISNRRPFAEVPPGEGAPDGLVVDADGGLWSARWEGGRVVHYASDGSVDHVIKMPVASPTSFTFGGPDLKDLYLTSAQFGQTAEQLAAAPWAGGLFRIRVDIGGQGDMEFAG